MGVLGFLLRMVCKQGHVRSSALQNLAKLWMMIYCSKLETSVSSSHNLKKSFDISLDRFLL